MTPVINSKKKAVALRFLNALISFFILMPIVQLWHGVSEERANGVDHQRLVMPSSVSFFEHPSVVFSVQ
jgi:hypothetical protein